MKAQHKRMNPERKAGHGQALIEYALILVLVAIALAAALIATGPALGNIFSNTVFNLIGITGTPQDLYARGGPTAFWQTVTAVALNPPSDRGFPPNPPLPATNTPTPGPSPTSTPITPSPTPSYTNTVPPTATPTDHGFNAPFLDPIDQPPWWRVDSSVYLGGDDWKGEYYPNRDLTGTAIEKWNAQLGPSYQYTIAFDWGTGSPIDGWISDDFSVRWTRNIYVFGTNPLTVVINIRSDAGVRFYVDNNLISTLSDWNNRTFDSTPLTATVTLTPGAHTLKLEYFEASGTAGVFLDIANYKANVIADTALPSGAASCQWARVTGTQPNSIAWAWKESGQAGNGFPPNMRCHLELRGFVDVSALANPTMSFWDVWDFGATTTVRLQLAEYQPYNPDGSGGPNWTQFPAVTLRTGGKNYAWTRSVVPIPNVTSKKITYRFVIESGGGTAVRRWYLDDILIDNVPGGRSFTVCSGNKATCGSYWNLDTTQQRNDFITTGRWDLTSTRTADNSPLAWDSSKTSGDTYVRFGPEQGTDTSAGSKDFRVHAVEWNGSISLPYNADGTGGLPDFEGDDGYPLLSFYHSYAIDLGERLEIQYTRDTLDAVEDNWTTLQVVASATSSALSQAMDFTEIELKNIPNWNTQPFRLRFAFRVSRDNTSGGGWWFDNIALERRGVPRFNSYPFCEDAESGSTRWLMGGQWGTTTTTGAFGSGYSFTDSPMGNYVHGQQTSMETRYVFDFNNDTPENLTTWGGNKDCNGAASGAAARPILTFWHRRQVAANESINVDIFRLANATSGTTAINPTAVWRYTYVARTRDQIAWERVEIDLQAAIEAVTGRTWVQLTTNPDPRDDDFFIAIRLDAQSDSSISDGVYIDNINIQNFSEVSHKLWEQSRSITPLAASAAPAGAGNGSRYVDDIDSPSQWWLRWQTGGEWTAIDWDAHSGARAMHDHPEQGLTYRHDTYNVLEMNRIIDLRGAIRTDNPTLYFWNHYDIGDSDSILVQVAVEDQYELTRTPIPPATTPPPQRNRQGYGYIYGWGSTTSYASSTSWETVWSRGSFTRLNTWGREQIDLRNYADDPATTNINEGKRLRVRFVLDTLDQSAGLRDGWYIDDIVVEFRDPRVFGLPFFDAAQNTTNWITEGSWGLAPDLWKGSGGGPAALGSNPYKEYFIDCIQWMYNWNRTAPGSGDLNQVACDINAANTFLNNVTRTVAGTQAYFNARPQWDQPARRLFRDTADVTYDFGTTGRPPGAAIGSAGSTWDDYFMGRWFRDINVLAGDYTFITTSDDGVRLRYDTIPSSLPFNWNIINNWTYHGRTVNLATVSLLAGDYQLIMEYFESTGSAVAILQVGNNNFSFSDSPKACAADTCPLVNSTPYGNSALILNGVLDLNNPGILAASWIPRLQYYNYWTLGASSSARTEVTIDGGFTWTQANLSGNCPASTDCSPTINGTSSRLPSGGYDWQLKSHDLRSYANRYIGLRFRLSTLSDVRDGWWITEIQVNN